VQARDPRAGAESAAGPEATGDGARTAFWQLQACVFLWGFTSILGKLIALPALALVLWRMAIATAILAVLPRVWRGLRGIGPRALGRHALAGSVIALHWFAFYASVKLANASVAVACLALGSVFAAIIEPWITGRPHERRELLLGVLAIPGVLLLIGGVPQGMQAGVAAGILAAALTATFASLNKRFLDPSAEPASVSLLQLGLGTLFLALLGAVGFGVDSTFVAASGSDLAWLVVLAVACTIVPFLLWLRALRHVSAFTTHLSMNLEPVYAIVLAALLFGEHRQLTLQFYAGVAVILATVMLQPRSAGRAARG
jgi:drug/metabolite transporter (DMT)-like permease